MKTAQLINGKDLRVGDTIDVWWKPGRDTITELRPYVGPYASFICSVAYFAINKVGMSIEAEKCEIVYNRLTPTEASKRRSNHVKANSTRNRLQYRSGLDRRADQNG